MRILRLDLIRFGAFTEAALDFSKAPRARPGLHLIYGPNEAGKSTARRALRCVLYGFPQRAAFDFLHRKKDLRVGVTIEDRVGQSHEFVRRRGNKNTLRGPDGEAVSERILTNALLGIERAEEFEQAFALGHEELRSGGEAMLDEDNAEGLFFMAATGLTRIRQDERGFAEAAAELFKPSGSKPPINHGFSEIKRLTQEQRAVEARADDYRDLENRLRAARGEHEDLGQKLIQARREQARLLRLEQAYPTHARLRQRRAERDELGEVPNLGEEFTEKRLACERGLEGTKREIALVEQQHAAIAEQLDALVIPGALIAWGETIDSLHEDLPVRRKEAKDSDRLRGESAGIEREMRSRLQEIGRDGDDGDPDSDLLRRQDEARIRKLAADRENFVDRITRERGRATILGQRLQDLEREVEELGGEVPLERLERSIRAATRVGDLDERIATLARKLREARREENQARSDLPLWSGTREQWMMLALPDDGTIEEFERQFADLERRRDQISDRRASVEIEHERTRHALAAIRHDRDVPDEQTLRIARQNRELGWQEIRREIEGREPGPDRASFLEEIGRDSLVEAYETAVREADTIVDRLRFEADTVGKIARLQADLERGATEISRLESDQHDLDDETADCDARWRELWAFLDALPRSPGKMRPWTASWRAARQRITAAIHLEEEQQELELQRAERRSDVIQELTDLQTPDLDRLREGSIGEVVRLAEDVRDAHHERNQRRSSLRKELRDLHPELVERNHGIEEATGELTVAEAEWSRWMTELGLPEATSSESALVVLDTLSAVDEFRRNLAEKQDRIGQMAENQKDFESRVVALLAEIAPDRRRSSSEVALGEIHHELVEARNQSRRRDDLREQAAEAARQIDEKRERLIEFEAELRLLCRHVGGADPVELPAMETRAAAAAELDRRILEEREDLLARGGGQSLDEFQRELDETDRDTIPARLKELDSEISRLSEQKERAAEHIVLLENDRAAFGGGEAAAEIAGEIAAVTARIAREIEHYAASRLAARLLREGRERYRRQSSNHQLEHASRIFTRLTGGAFQELRIDFDERDRQTLFAFPADSRPPISPSGLSDGTRDQLYFALRIAWLHLWLDDHEPLPFLVDDLLIHFDDDRAAAALEVLADLARRTQVLFFTHHDHLRELARDLLPDEILHEQELPSLAGGQGQAPGFLENGRNVASPTR